MPMSCFDVDAWVFLRSSVTLKMLRDQIKALELQTGHDCDFPPRPPHTIIYLIRFWLLLVRLNNVLLPATVTGTKQTKMMIIQDELRKKTGDAEPLFLWKSNKYYIFWMCVCSLSYPACTVLYCQVWPLLLCNIFLHYVIKGTIFAKRSY